jgi:hypothetical protein
VFIMENIPKKTSCTVLSDDDDNNNSNNTWNITHNTEITVV